MGHSRAQRAFGTFTRSDKLQLGGGTLRSSEIVAELCVQCWLLEPNLHRALLLIAIRRALDVLLHLI